MWTDFIFDCSQCSLHDGELWNQADFIRFEIRYRLLAAVVCVKCQTFLVTENYKGVKLMAEGWELLDILTDFTLGRTMRSILAGQCEDLGTLHIKPASSPKRKLYIRWAESSAREVWGVDCMGSADTADGEMDIASSHHHAPPLTPLSSQGWPVTSYLWYSLTVLCPNFTYTVTYPLIFNYWMTYPFVAISGYEDCLCHGLPEWHFDAAITDMMTSDHQRILVWF